MNYEELLESRNGAAMSKEQIPFGCFYKKHIDNKYVNVLDLRHHLADNIQFCEDLVTESKQNATLMHKSQLHFTVEADSAGIYGISLEPGSYQTFADMLEKNPATVAGKNFIDDTVKDLLEFASFLHEKGIHHICYSPDNIFARKNDHRVMLLFHGSAYANIKNQKQLYKGAEAYLAPEVLEEGALVDERADIYSIGKFIEFLFAQSSIPFEYKSVLKKATAENPDERYHTADDMLKDITRKRGFKKTFLSAVAAIAICLVCVGLYFELLPQPDEIEYVNPVKENVPEDPLDDGFDMASQLDMLPLPEDTTEVTPDDMKQMKEYDAKAEQIFRKKFTQKAEKILSRIYDNQHMGASEKQFLATSSSTMEELVKAQQELTDETHLDATHTQRIASDIVDQVIDRLKSKEQKSYGVQKESSDEEE